MTGEPPERPRPSEWADALAQRLVHSKPHNASGDEILVIGDRPDFCTIPCAQSPANMEITKAIVSWHVAHAIDAAIAEGRRAEREFTDETLRSAYTAAAENGYPEAAQHLAEFEDTLQCARKDAAIRARETEG